MSERTVMMADMAVSADGAEVLVTYALGSCLGIAIHDPIARVGGLLHVMLPSSRNALTRDGNNPCMFIDTGVPLLFRACYLRGALKDRIRVTVAGGATCTSEVDHFQIGRRNVELLRRLLLRNGLVAAAEDVGGGGARHMYLEIGSGAVRVRSPLGQELVL